MLITKRVLWILVTLLCVLFAPMAAEFYLVLHTNTTPTYARVLSALVSHDYAMGETSGMTEMTPYWKSMPRLNQILLGLHAALATVSLVLGPFLLSGSIRNRWPRIHRKMGRIYFGFGTVAILLSIAYLLLTPLERVYGGRPFAIGLWGIAILTLYTFVMGFFHIVRGEVEQHRAILLLNFCALLIAPLLRLWWLVLGRLFMETPGNTQANNHVAVLLFLGLQTVIAAIVSMSLFTRGPAASRPPTASILRLRSRTRAVLPQLTSFALAAGILLALGLLHQSVLRLLGGGDLFAAFRPTATLERELEVFATHPLFFWARALGLAGIWILAPLLIRRVFSPTPHHANRTLPVLFGLSILCACAGWFGLAAGYGTEGVRGWGSAIYWGTVATSMLILFAFWGWGLTTGHARRVREFTLHLYALALTPLTVGLMQWAFLRGGFPWGDAFLSAGVTGTSFNLSLSYYYTVYGSHAPSPSPEAPRPAQPPSSPLIAATPS